MYLLVNKFHIEFIPIFVKIARFVPVFSASAHSYVSTPKFFSTILTNIWPYATDTALKRNNLQTFSQSQQHLLRNMQFFTQRVYPSALTGFLILVYSLNGDLDFKTQSLYIPLTYVSPYKIICTSIVWKNYLFAQFSNALIHVRCALRSVYTQRDRDRERERGFSCWNCLVFCRGTVQIEYEREREYFFCARERPP